MQGLEILAYIILIIGILNIIEYYNLKKKGKFTIYFFNNYLIKKFDQTFIGRLFFNERMLKIMTLRGAIGAIIVGLLLLYQFG